MNPSSEISIVIPSYNGRKFLERCLTTLSTEAPDAEIIVVDGQSPDGSAQLVRDRFPHVRLRSCKNHGWAHATNRGVEVAERPYLLCLNSDAFVTEEALAAMRTRLHFARDVAAVAPMLNNEDGTRQALFGIWYWPTWKPITRPTPVPVLSGACLMTRRDVYESVGAFDENFFLYNEELDWCHRAKSAGYRLEILPTSVVHIGGGSTGKNPLLRLEEQRGFIYLSSKHWPAWVTSLLRQGMRFEGKIRKHLDGRPAHKAMWEALESTMAREAYLESPFQLSGRGIPSALLRPEPGSSE